MCQVRLLFAALLGVLLVVAGRASQGDEPTVLGKKAAAWLEMLQTDPSVKHRRAALIALASIGPKVRGVVPGVVGALQDAEAEVRQDAARTLGQMGVDAKEAVEPLARVLRADKAG